MGKLKLKTLYIAGLVIAGICAPLMPWYCVVLVTLFFLSVLFLACITLSLNFFIPSKCKAITSKKLVALTFDDGPARYTENILDTLQKHNVQASFFCIGKNIPGNPLIMNRLKNEGHVIGNHSYSHGYWFDMSGAGKMLADMRQMDREVEKAVGLRPLLFRPPYGVMNPSLAQAIKKGGYTSIGWNIRSFDTRIKDKQKLTSRIIGQLKPGSIILLHDSMEITAAILPELIKEIESNGYTITRLDKMLNISAYA